MGFKGRRKRKYKATGKFVERMRKIQKEAKAVLGKAQEIKKFVDKKQREGEEYRIGDLVLLSTKGLKWQIKRRRIEKLIEHFVRPYKIKEIISSNVERVQKGIVH